MVEYTSKHNFSRIENKECGVRLCFQQKDNKGNRLAQTVRLELGALIDFQDLATVFGSAEYVAKATRRIANYPSVILYTSKNEKCKSKLHVFFKNR